MAFTILPLQAQHASFIAECLAQDMPTNPVQRLLYADRTVEQARKDYEGQFAMYITDPEKSHQYRWIRAVTPSGENAAWAEWHMPKSQWAKEHEPGRGTVDEIEQETKPSRGLDAVIAVGTAADDKSAQENTQEGQGETAEITARQMQKNRATTAFGQQWHEMESSARQIMLQERAEYWVLCNLGTHPAFRKQGAATLLTSWAFEDADRKGLPIILHAVLDCEGLPLYRKLGFEEKSRFVMDLGTLGGEGTFTTVCMLREPRLLGGNPDA